jgi:hypothetical protein
MLASAFRNTNDIAVLVWLRTAAGVEEDKKIGKEASCMVLDL